jgi:hypothetical protein
MPPIEIEVNNKVVKIENNKVDGYLLPRTNLGFVCKTTEDGGVVRFLRKTNILNSCHGYENAGIVDIKKGDEPITRKIRCRLTGTNEIETIETKITAF